MGRMCQALLPNTETEWSPRGKALRLLSELGAKRAAFPKERRFYSKEYLLRIEYIWQTFSQKTKKKDKKQSEPINSRKTAALVIHDKM